MAVSKTMLTVTPFKASERLKSLSETPIYVKALIYGEAGAGKTWTACTAPKPLLVISEWAMSRLTLERLRQDRGIDPDVIYVTSEDEAIEAYKYAKANADKYESFVLDGITDINDRIMWEVLDEVRGKVSSSGKKHDEEILEEGDWQRVLRRTTYILQLFRDLPGHTIVTALATEEDMKIIPMIYPKSLRKRLSSQFNMVGYLTVEALGRPGAAKVVRKLITEVGVAHQAKSPGGFVPPVVENPDLSKLIPMITSTKKAEEVSTSE